MLNCEEIAATKILNETKNEISKIYYRIQSLTLSIISELGVPAKQPGLSQGAWRGGVW